MYAVEKRNKTHSDQIAKRIIFHFWPQQQGKGSAPCLENEVSTRKDTKTAG